MVPVGVGDQHKVRPGQAGEDSSGQPWRQANLVKQQLSDGFWVPIPLTREATVPSGAAYQPGSAYWPGRMSSRTFTTVNMPPISMFPWGPFPIIIGQSC